MNRPPPRFTRTDTLVPYPTRFRSPCPGFGRGLQMIFETITANRRSFASVLGPRCPDNLALLPWTVIQSVGLLPGDIVYAPIELAVFQHISARAGFETPAQQEKAPGYFLYRRAGTNLPVLFP